MNLWCTAKPNYFDQHTHQRRLQNLAFLRNPNYNIIEIENLANYDLRCVQNVKYLFDGFFFLRKSMKFSVFNPVDVLSVCYSLYFSAVFCNPLVLFILPTILLYFSVTINHKLNVMSSANKYTYSLITTSGLC